METQEIGLANYQRFLKEKFVQVGLEDFFDREVLKLLFSYSRPRKESRLLAESLLENYGSFKKIVDAPLGELVAYPGMDGHSAILLKFIKEGSQFYLKDTVMKQNAILKWKDIISYCRFSMEGLKNEHFKVVFLDNRNLVCGIETMCEGTIDHAIIYPRSLIKKALDYNARNLVLAHNHPSGDPAPSSQDIAITEELFNATKSVDIEIQDHLIIGCNKYFSFRDSGLLFNFQN
jgi:DNA repair protein RadC